MNIQAFIIDCPWCKSKVSAVVKGMAEKLGDDEGDNLNGNRIMIGECPTCSSLLVGESTQISFAGYDSDDDEWSHVSRVHPKPNKTFSSTRIPKVVIVSLAEADRAMQADANIAACVMLGRALEALCRDVIEATHIKPAIANAQILTSAVAQTTPSIGDNPETNKKKVMLGEGIRRLKELGVIDDRLFDWSQQLNAFRNLAAHPEDIAISHEDAGDLQSFVYAIVEYVYDLTDKYNEFIERKNEKKPNKT